MRTALLVIALGGDYRQYLGQLLVSAQNHFVSHTPIVWTDDLDAWTPPGAQKIYQRAMGFPEATLYRYRLFAEQSALLGTFDQLYYTDVDMTFAAPVKEEDIFSDGITATLHPGFIIPRPDRWGQISTVGTPERNPRSMAFIDEHAMNRYFCGGFNGGEAAAFLTMADVIQKRTDIDTQSGITAIWHDESHLNRYLYDNPPAKILTPSFCYPEGYHGQFGWAVGDYSPTLVALDKRKKR